MWELPTEDKNYVYDRQGLPEIMLGIFLVRLDVILVTGGNVSAVNSTAVVSNVQPSYNGTVLKCSEYADLSMFREIVVRVAGESHHKYICSALSRNLRFL